MSVGCAKVWTHRYLGHVTERAGAWANLEDMWLANMFGMLETPGYARSQGLPLGYIRVILKDLRKLSVQDE